MPYKFAVNVKERQDKLPTMYWSHKLHKRPHKARFIANSSSCTKTELSKLFTSCLPAVKSRVIRFYETVYERSRKNMFGLSKNLGSVSLTFVYLRTFSCLRICVRIFYEIRKCVSLKLAYANVKNVVRTNS